MAVSHRDPYLRAQLRDKYRAFQETIKQELRSHFPAASPQTIRATSYSLMCLALGSAAMYDLDMPARKHRDARRSAMHLLAQLRHAST